MATPNSKHIRQAVSNMYDGPLWKTRVARMPSAQVYAIYMGYQEKNNDREKTQMVVSSDPHPTYIQEKLF